MARTKRQCTSIYDLAKQTGLSASTVSRVLNQRGRISHDTRLRVLAAAREVGFRPRASVRQNTVAVVIDRLRYSTLGGFVASMLTHLIAELAHYDMSAEVYTEENVGRLGTRFIDGVLALTWDATTLAKLRDLNNVPVVVINRGDLTDVSTAATDHFQGGRMVAEHLLSCGHRQIAFVGEEQDWGADQRVAGMNAAVSQAGGKPGSVAVAFTEHHELEGALRRLLDQQPSALFLAGEDLTIEAMHCLTTVLGVRIPDDLSLIGMENGKVSQYVHPPLTSLSQPLDKLASAALELITTHIDSHDTKPRRKLLPNALIERQSVARAG